MLIANDEFLAVGHPVVDASMDYWHMLAASRAMPLRSELDPTDIPRLLPHAILLDVLRDPLDFYFRIVGQHIIDNFGQSPVRRTLSDIVDANPSTARLFENFRSCVRQRRPMVVEDRFMGADTMRKRTYGTILPLADAHGAVTHLFCVTVFLDRDGHQVG